MTAQQVEVLLLVLLVAANVLADTTTSPTQTAESNNEEPEAVDPFLEDLCIIENSTEAYRVNTEWTEDACDQKCRCVFRSTPLDDSREVLLLKTINMNSTSEPTEIRCSMPPKCGPIESRAYIASRCARPLLAFTNGEPCSCPKLYCSDTPFMAMKATSSPNVVSSITTATTTTNASTTKASITTTTTATPVPTTTTTQRQVSVTVGPSILQPVKSATTTQRLLQTTTTTSTPHAYTPELVSVESQTPITSEVLYSGPTTTTTSISTSTIYQPPSTVGPSILQPVKNASISQRPSTARVSGSPETQVTEGPTTNWPTSTASIISTTTITTSDSSTQATSDNSFVSNIVTAATQKPMGCAKKSLDDFEAIYEECQSSCRCENNKLKCGSLQEAQIIPSQSIDLEPLPWTQQIQSRMNVQKYAWHLLVGFVTMSVMFIIVLFMYMKKSTFVMTSLAAQTGYDNASYNSRLTEKPGSRSGLSSTSSESFEIGRDTPHKWETTPNLSSQLPGNNKSAQVYW